MNEGKITQAESSHGHKVSWCAPQNMTLDEVVHELAAQNRISGPAEYSNSIAAELLHRVEEYDY